MWTTVLIYKGCHSFQCFLSSWSICWRCDELRACVECSVFHQYWKHYASAFECHQVMREIRSELDNRKMFMIRNAAGIHSSTSPLRGRRCAQCRFQSAWMFKFSNKVNCSLSTSHIVGSMGRLMPTSARWGERIGWNQLNLISYWWQPDPSIVFVNFESHRFWPGSRRWGWGCMSRRMPLSIWWWLSFNPYIGIKGEKYHVSSFWGWVGLIL